MLYHIHMEKLTFENAKRDKITNILCEKGFSYQSVNKLLRQKDVRVNDIKIKDNIVVEPMCEITVFYDKTMLEERNFDIIYQDNNIAIVNKPCGIEIEGVEGLARKLALLPLHRLDRNTTGLVVFAKNKTSQDILLQAFANKTIQKKYLAEVVGKTCFKDYLYTAYLVKDKQNSLVKIFDSPTKNAVEIKTIFNTLKSSEASSLIQATLLTGKTHQIRASLAHLNHPIIGDGKYGRNEDNKKFKAKTQRLHAYSIKFQSLASPLQYLNQKEFICMPNFANVDNLA